MKIKTVLIRMRNGSYVICHREGETKKDIKKFLKNIYGRKIAYKDLNLCFSKKIVKRVLFEDVNYHKEIHRENDILTMHTIYLADQYHNDFITMVWIFNEKTYLWHWVPC